MITLKLNNKDVNVPEGISVMTAARMAGIEVPSMCFREGKPHFTSCMICMVKDNNSGKLFPSCSVKVTEGMDINTKDEEVVESRKMALELLLSEHVGDCEAPCQITCPAHMDIPLMNRLLAEGKFAEALQVVKKDIALPGVFGRICPAPCEGACRRKQEDTSVSICLLKRYAGDHDLLSDTPYSPEIKASSGKKVAIIGSGPAGLAAAYYLSLRGHACEVYDRNEKAGGTLWNEVKSGKLEADVLEKEIQMIAETGVQFFMNREIDGTEFGKVEKKADAILITTGEQKDKSELSNLQMSAKGIEVKKGTYETSVKKVFAAGSAVRPAKLAIRTLGQGKEAAFSIDQFLSGDIVKGEPFLFNSRFGKLLTSEVDEYMKEADRGNRIEPKTPGVGLTMEQVMKEAARCMHCDCRAINDCKLRTLSEEYEANQKHYWSEDRNKIRKFGFEEQHVQHDLVVYEPNKCIKCGICVHITEEHKEKFGMSFIGRGFDVVVNVPFSESLKEGLAKVAEEAARACPTGALSKF